MANLTAEQVKWAAELYRCQRDFPYTASTYFHIKSKHTIGLPTLRPNKVQRFIYAQMMDQLKRTGKIRLILGKSRQVGASTLARAFSMWHTAFKPNRNSLLVTHDEPTSFELFTVDQLMYENLPGALKPKLKYDSKSKMEFAKLNSKVTVGHARNMNVGASGMQHFVHLTEVARYPNADEIQASLFPSISDASGTDYSVVIMESTSHFNGTWFKEFAEAAKRGENGYEFHFVPWYEHEDYQSPVPHQFSPNADERDLMRRYKLTLNQIAWRRAKRAEYVNPAVFEQEFPLCLIGSTRIATQRGIIYLCDARVGDETESGRIDAVIPQGIAETWTATTSLGYQVTGTTIHRLLQADGTFVQLGQSQGAVLSLRPPRFADDLSVIRWSEIPSTTTSLTITPEWGRFLGYFMGDGSFYPTKGSHEALRTRPHGTLSIACTARDTDVVKDVDGLLKVLFGYQAEQRHPSPGCTELRVSNGEFFRPLLECGVIARQGCEQRWKRLVCVPEPIWRSPRGVVREFLRGLYESDGHVRKTGTVLLNSKYKVFLADVQLLLLGFGITAKLTKWKRDGAGWCLVCRAEESRVFMRDIGFVSAWKTARAQLHKPWRGRPSQALCLTDVVVRVEPAQTEPVYDITLPDPHTFSANGIAVHNSWADSWRLPQGTLRAFNDDDLTWVANTLRPGKRAQLMSEGVTYSIGGPLEVWAEPVEGVYYHVGVDVASGRDANTDWTVCEVVRGDTFEQVAEARFHWDPADADFHTFVHKLGQWYNMATIIPDITGGWGHALLSELQRRNYPNLWQWKRRDDLKEKITTRVGFLYTKRDKIALVNNGVTLVKQQRAMIHSLTLYNEMLTFLQVGLDQWGGAPGTYDDTVNGWLLAVLSAADATTGVITLPTYQRLAPAPSTPWATHDIDKDIEAHVVRRGVLRLDPFRV